MKIQRNTKQRQMVLQALRAHAHHPTADQIYLDVREQDPKISRGTVYRNLNLLAENGDILHVRTPGADHFDHRTDSHYHVICMGCGTVCDAEIPYRDDDDLNTERVTGYIINRHRTVFEGVCPLCHTAQRAKCRRTSEPTSIASQN